MVPFDNENEFKTSNCKIKFDGSDFNILKLLSFSVWSDIKGVAGSKIIISSSFNEAFWLSKELFILDICSNPVWSFWLQHYIIY